MTTFIIDTEKGKVEYSTKGNGKVILIVHGGHVSCKEDIFQKGFDTNKFCFITPSRPGYGNTPLTGSNRSPKETAELIIALLDKIKVAEAIVIGISAGGLTALELAANYPQRIEKLILQSALTKKWFSKTDKLYIRSKKAFAPKIEKFTWFIYRLLFKLIPVLMTRIMYRELSTHRPVKYAKDEFNELKHMTINMRSGYGFHNDLDQTIDQEILSKIECQTLVLHSEYDNAVDISHAQNANDNIRNSKLITFKNHWGHLLWIGKDYEAILCELKRDVDQ